MSEVQKAVLGAVVLGDIILAGMAFFLGIFDPVAALLLGSATVVSIALLMSGNKRTS